MTKVVHLTVEAKGVKELLVRVDSLIIGFAHGYIELKTKMEMPPESSITMEDFEVSLNKALVNDLIELHELYSMLDQALAQGINSILINPPEPVIPPGAKLH